MSDVVNVKNLFTQKSQICYVCFITALTIQFEGILKLQNINCTVGPTVNQC